MDIDPLSDEEGPPTLVEIGSLENEADSTTAVDFDLKDLSMVKVPISIVTGEWA